MNGVFTSKPSRTTLPHLRLPVATDKHFVQEAIRHSQLIMHFPTLVLGELSITGLEPFGFRPWPDTSFVTIHGLNKLLIKQKLRLPKTTESHLLITRSKSMPIYFGRVDGLCSPGASHPFRMFFRELWANRQRGSRERRAFSYDSS